MPTDTLTAPRGRNLRPGPRGPALAQRHASYETGTRGTRKGLEDRLQSGDEGWGAQHETLGGGGAQQPSRPFCPRSTSVFSPSLPSPAPSLQALRSPFSYSASIQISAGAAVIGWFRVRPPPPSSLSFRSPCLRSRGRMRRIGCTPRPPPPPSLRLSSSPRSTPPGVTEDSRARALSAPPALSPGPFGGRGRE